MSRRLAHPPGVTAALAVLVFATPITLYGAMFWEHTLGVLLAFCGVEYLLTRMLPKHSGQVPIFWGIITGAAVWIRPELICLIMVMGLIAAIAAIRQHRREGRWFMLGLFLNVVGLLVFNSILYGHPFGVHGYQVVGRAIESVGEAGYWPLLSDLVLYAPVTVFVLLALLIGGGRLAEAAGRSRGRPLVIMSVAFLVLVPWILPNLGGKQWGPRYLLVLMPVLSLLGGMLLGAILDARRKAIQVFGAILFVLSLVVGGYLNTYLGSMDLIADYRLRIKPALDLLHADSCKLVAVTEQWTAQELASAFDSKTFFWTHDSRQLSALADRAHQHDLNRFLLITSPLDRPPSRVEFERADLTITGISIRSIGVHGDYAIYAIDVIVN